MPSWSKPNTRSLSVAAPKSAMLTTHPARRVESRENVNRASHEGQRKMPGLNMTRHLGYGARQRGHRSSLIWIEKPWPSDGAVQQVGQVAGLVHHNVVPAVEAPDEPGGVVA